MPNENKEGKFVVGSDHDVGSVEELPLFFPGPLREIPVAGVIPALQSHKYGKWIRLDWAGNASAKL
jgi:hypothetical protein